MDILEFVSRSEWPLVVAGTLWLLRKPLRTMFEDIIPTKISGLGLNVEFDRKLEKAKILTTPSAKEETSIVEFSERSQESNPDSLSFVMPFKPNTSPDSIVLLAWRRLENGLRKMWMQLPANSSPLNKRLFKTTSAGQDLGLTKDEVGAIRELRSIRNKIAHSEDAPISESEAIKFVEITERLISRLMEEEKKRKNIPYDN